MIFDPFPVDAVSVFWSGVLPSAVEDCEMGLKAPENAGKWTSVILT